MAVVRFSTPSVEVKDVIHKISYGYDLLNSNKQLLVKLIFLYLIYTALLAFLELYTVLLTFLKTFFE